MKDYYVHRNDGNAVFVKDGDFFIEQGGLTNSWGKAWKKVRADSIEHARLIGENLIPKKEIKW